jgi:hypothetical protein
VSIGREGNLDAGFTKGEVDAILREKFNGEMNLRVMAGLVGSDIRGPSDLTSLHSKDFKINFVENTQA